MTVSVEQIKTSLAAKTTEKLRAALERHDKSEYTDQAFEAMRQILTERGIDASLAGVETPQRNPLTGEVSASPSRTNVIRDVVVTDIKMPFGSMVVFMVKWAIASIPALIILFLLAALVSAILVGLGVSLLR
jgi:hypothetical protein